MKELVIGITGASGSILAKSVIERLLEHDCLLHVVATPTGRAVFEYELNTPLNDYLNQMALDYPNQMRIHDIQAFFAPIASGSFDIDAMIVVPCSMGTLGKIAHGTSDHLLARAADVCLKEKRPLVLVTRETPLSSLHLENMLSVSRNGATILPPVPAFYHKPQTVEALIEHTVSRILRSAGVASKNHEPWTGL